MSYDVDGPDPVSKRSITKPIRTAVVLGILAVAVVIAGRWGWEQVTQPFGDEAAAASASANATPLCTPGPDSVEPLPAPTEITVNVYNASGVGGAAANGAEQLAAQGFVIGAVDNDPLNKSLEDVGEVRSSADAKPQVDQLLRYVPGAVWVQDQRPSLDVDFAVGAGFTGVATPDPLPEQPAENTEDDIPTC